jgi:hypothetical protein
MAVYDIPVGVLSSYATSGSTYQITGWLSRNDSFVVP